MNMFFVRLTLVSKKRYDVNCLVSQHDNLDQSGKIDFREFLQAINIASQGTPEKKLELAFRMYDCNNDGSIDQREMKHIISVN